jgi:biopolymer transport protein ExbD
MAFVPRRRSPDAGLNLTPMIDVTFQLLIFFVCANTWSHVESSEPLSLPAPIASASEAKHSDRPRLTINLRADGSLLLGAQPITRERLGEVLKREVRLHGQLLEVILRAHKETPYEHTQQVFRTCSDAGVKSVRFAVLKTRLSAISFQPSAKRIQPPGSGR